MERDNGVELVDLLSKQEDFTPATVAVTAQQRCVDVPTLTSGTPSRPVRCVSQRIIL